MLEWIVENTVMALVLAAGVCIACRLFKARPAVCHFLWVLVLVRLVAPPVSITHWPPEPMRDRISGFVDSHSTQIASQFAHYLSLSGGALHADNRSVSAGSAAPVQPNPIEPALLPEERTAPAAAAASPQPLADSSSSEPASRIAPTAQPSPPAESNAVQYAANAWNSDPKAQPPQPDEAESAEPMASEMTLAEMKREQVAWKDLYADKKMLRAAAGDADGSMTLPPWAARSLRTLGLALLAIWAVGALVALAIHIRRIARFHAAVRQAPMAPPWLADRVDRLADELGLAAPAVRTMRGLSSPVIWGFGAPTLLWPTGDAALAQHDAQRCDGIIVHELAHLRRRDHWLAWFEVFAVSLLWWHPLAHLACRRLHEYADLACDSWVVSMLPTHRGLYAASIVDLIEQLSTAPRAALALGVGTSSRRSLVERRLIMIVKERTVCRLSPAAALAALLGVAALVPSWAGGASGWLAPPTEVSIDPAIAAEHGDLIREAILQRRAETFYNTKDWQRAAGAYEAILQAQPDHSHAASRLSYCLMAMGELDRAQHLLEQQIEKSREPAIAHYNLACVLAGRGQTNAAFEQLTAAVTFGFDQLELVNTDSDLDALRDDDRFRAFAGDVNFVDSLQKQGQQAINEEDWAAAAVHFGKLARLAPNDGQAQHMLSYASILASRDADSHARRDEYLATARAAQARQIELDHLPAVGHYNAACVDAIQGRVDSGLDHLAASINLGFRDFELMRGDPDLDGLRGNSRFNDLLASVESAPRPKQEIADAIEAGDYQHAAKLLQAAGKMADQNGDLSWSLGYAQFGDGEYAQAEQSFLRALQRGHDAGDAVYNLACCAARQGRTTAALGYLEAAVHAGFLDAEHMQGDDDLASIRDEKRFEDIINLANDSRILENFGAADWNHLLSQSEKQVAKDSTNGGAHLRQGWALLRLGRYEDARAAFARQSELGFAPSIASYNIACCETALGRHDRAIEVLAQLATQDHGGILNAAFVNSDPDLKALHNHPRFKEIVAAFEKHDEQMEKTVHVESHDGSHEVHWEVTNEAEHDEPAR